MLLKVALIPIIWVVAADWNVKKSFHHDKLPPTNYVLLSAVLKSTM